MEDTAYPQTITRTVPRVKLNAHGERPALKVERVEDADMLGLLRFEWDTLLRNSGADCLFLTWEWLATWWKHLSAGRRLHLLVVRRGDQLLAIAPLALRPPQLQRLLPFRTLEFMGGGDVGSDYLDIIVQPHEEQGVLQALADYLQERGLVIELSRVKPASRRIATLVSLLGQAGWQAEQKITDNCPYIPLAGQSWQSYMAGVSGAHRRNVRRRLKLLAEDFRTVEFRRSATETERQDDIETFFGLHRLRWSGDERSTALTGPAVLSFHREFSRLALERGWLRLYVLRLDGTAVASTYSFRYGDAFYYYQAGYDPAYNDHSVGLSTLALVVQEAIAEGVAEFDMLHGVESYKALWTRSSRDLVRVHCFPPSVRGTLCRRALNLKQNLKRLVRRGPMPLQEVKA
ncbi:MAG TPA: GNAT family N-acetyltransferase [Gammaproteobacteria bacterium]